MKKIYLIICVLFFSIAHSQNNTDLESAQKAKAEKEARAEAEKTKAKADAEVAQKAKLAAEAKVRADADAGKLKMAADAKAKADAEERFKLVLVENFKTNISNLASHALVGSSTPTKVKDDNPIDADGLGCDKPKTLNDLDGGYDVFFSSTKYTLDINGKIVFVSAASNTSKTNLNYKFLQYKKQKCTINGREEEVVYGCGVDLSLDVKSKKNSANISSLPNIAAAVTYKDADVQYKLKVIGITGDAIRSNLNINGDFDVDNYGKIISKIDEILKNMGTSGVNISPQLIVLEK
jgi:hypothetical protein